MDIKVLEGDIAQVESDAIITAINSFREWNGGIDKAIRRVAGMHFHDQITATMVLRQNDTMLATGEPHRGKFRHVVFVVDDLQDHLSEVVLSGLLTAASIGFTSVTLPTIRMGLMIGKVEKSVEDAINQMCFAVEKFVRENPDTTLTSITFVVYDDPAVADLLRSELSNISLAA